MSGKVIDDLKEKRDRLKRELLDLQDEVKSNHTKGFNKYNKALEFIFRTDTSFLDDNTDVIEFLKTKHPNSRNSM